MIQIANKVNGLSDSVYSVCDYCESRLITIDEIKHELCEDCMIRELQYDYLDNREKELLYYGK